MPQMSPMLWLLLMNFSLANLMLILIIIYFYWSPANLIKNSQNLLLKFKFNFKW